MAIDEWGISDMKDRELAKQLRNPIACQEARDCMVREALSRILIATLHKEKSETQTETKERTWETWTLSEEDIEMAAKAYSKSLLNIDLDRVAGIFKKKVAASIGDQWDEFLSDAIQEAKEES